MTDSPRTEPLGASAAPADVRELTLAGGCFWCLDAVYRRVRGVLAVESGYTGGDDPAPSYESVCTGTTGHDPTSLNRQGADVGTQYRSAVFAHDEAEARFFADEIARAQANYDSPIVTRVEPASAWHPAEDIHQDFYARRRSNGYCRVVIDPKLAKVRRNYSAWLVDA